MLALCYAHDGAAARELRRQHLGAHLTFVEENLASIRLAGPWYGDDGEMAGSLFIIEAESLEAAAALLRRDPYTQAGVWQSTALAPFFAAAGSYVGGKNW
jgi:hypothetical protein